MIGEKSIFGSIKGEKENFVADEHWERRALVNVAMSVIDEQRKARRWGVFFKLAMLAYLVAIFVVYAFPPKPGINGNAKKEHVAIVDVKGLISSKSYANADDINSSLNDAFKNERSKAVVLRIDSGGGSPVQSGYVYDEIMRLRQKYPDKKVFAVVEDVCASGAYYIAAAADEIYADKASIVGSIGVRMGSFGFVDAMKKLGVERRMITAGENKGFGDPFSPQSSEVVEHSKKLVAGVHKQFIDAVRKGRGERLKETYDMFSGLIWTGEQSLELGLVDKLGSLRQLVRDELKQENTVVYSPQKGLLDSLKQQFGILLQESMSSVGYY
ncbi:MAG: S49 family peptidase [Gammaproteobacteria bacterium]|nr:MAG: S49 family peptidase [Gammaproteobacteria bacterium]